MYTSLEDLSGEWLVIFFHKEFYNEYKTYIYNFPGVVPG